MGGLDAPGFRVEVVGAVADILHGAERDTFVGDGNEATRGICRQHESLAPKVFQSLGVREVDAWEFALGKIGGEDSEFRIKSEEL